ncbi:MAG: esterase/lipase family protein [Oligoflexus sp.]
MKDIAVSSPAREKIITREILASIASGLLFPLGFIKSKKRMPKLKDQRTIVLIHGYGGNPSSLLPITQYLRICGVQNIISFRYQAKYGIDRAARELKEFLRSHVRGGRIDFVCHSLGGLIARVYLQDLGGARRVDRCITLGTPHRGTYNAYWLSTRVGRELRPDSDFLARLERSKEQAARVQFLSIVAGSDMIVIPRIFAQGNENVMYVPDLGHLGLLFSPTVFRTVGRCLQGMEFSQKSPG